MNQIRGLMLMLAMVTIVGGMVGSMTADATNVVASPANVRFKYNLALDTPSFLVQDLSWNCAPVVPGPTSYLWLSSTGVLAGTCFYDPDPGNPYVDRVEATMSGSINLETGAVAYSSSSTFKEAKHSLTTGSVSHTVTLDGNGTASGNYASGNVNFAVTSSCEPAPQCDPAKTYSYSGTVPFEMILTPIDEVDLKLQQPDIIQVVQDEIGTVPLVAQRDTVVRVYLQTDTVVPEVRVKLTAKAGTVDLPGEAELLKGSSNVPLITPDRSVTAGSYNFRLPASWTAAGLVYLKIKAEAPAGVTDSAPGDNEMTVPALFEDRKRLSVGYLPVCAYIDVEANAVCPQFGYELADSFADRIFPSPGGVKSIAFPMPQYVWKYEPETDPYGDGLIAILRKLYDISVLLAVDDDEVPDQLAAWLPPIGGNLPGGYSDPVWAGSTGRVSFSQFYSDDSDYSSFLLAHEVAHNLGRRHTNRSDACGAQDPTTDWPTGMPFSSTLAYGWDNVRNVVVPPDRQDLMTYCASLISNMWISPFTYMKLFDGNFEPRTVNRSRAPASYLVVSGMAHADNSAGVLDSAYPIQSSMTPDAVGTGNTHCLRFNNNPANDYCFKLNFEEHKTHQALEKAWFSVVAPLPADTTKVALMAGRVELAVLTASPNSPHVTFTSFPANATWDGVQTLNWSATDDDGGSLRSLLLYSRDTGESWLPLNIDDEESSMTFDTDQVLPGNVLFKVIVTDGLRVSEAVSPQVTVLGVSGDVTCDGVIGLDDVLGVRRDVAGIASPPICIASGDVNCSGLRETGDALALLRSVAGLGVSYPQDCPPIGED